MQAYFFLTLFIFRERGREGERERQSMCGCLSCPPLGIWPATQALAPTGSQTGNPLVHHLSSIH